MRFLHVTENFRKIKDKLTLLSNETYGSLYWLDQNQNKTKQISMFSNEITFHNETFRLFDRLANDMTETLSVSPEVTILWCNFEYFLRNLASSICSLLCSAWETPRYFVTVGGFFCFYNAKIHSHGSVFIQNFTEIKKKQKHFVVSLWTTYYFLATLHPLHMSSQFPLTCICP